MLNNYTLITEEEEIININSQDVKILENILQDTLGTSPTEVSSIEYFPDLNAKLEPFPYRQQPSVINTEEYAGPYNFEVMLNPHENRNIPWVYSTRLHKLFIQMHSIFPVDFKWDNPSKDLFVRATALFCQPQYSQEVVARCLEHSQPTDKSNENVAPSVWDHIIRCQDDYALYFGSKDNREHLSVVSQLGSPQNGAETVRKLYLFLCKNSCTTGMNRRAIQVVFTLEDKNCEVLGRRKVCVRICSCPKRDSQKEEKEHIRNNAQNLDAPPPGKKRKMVKKEINTDVSDEQEILLPIKVPNKAIAIETMKSVQRILSSEAYYSGNKSQMQPYLENCERILKNLSD